MFGKKKKAPKVEQVFNPPEEEKSSEEASAAYDESEIEIAVNEHKMNSGEEETSDEKEELTKEDQLNKVKSKISKILQSSNVEIVDENEGDEYEQSSVDDDLRKQQDYDELKALFGSDKNKKQELTLTIDDFDYTYVGQYVDEFDLQHAKSIKRVKIRRKHSKVFVRVAIIMSLVVVLGIGAFLGFYLTRQKPVYLKNVTLSQTEDNYYVSQFFDYTGLYFDLEYSDGRHQRVPVTANNLTRSTGYFNEENGMMIATGRADLVFTYEGFNLTYVITIKQSEVNTDNPIVVDFADGLFSLKTGDVIGNNMIRVYVNFDIGKTLAEFTQYSLQVAVDGNTYVDCVRGQNGWTLPNQVAGTTEATKFKVIYQVSNTQRYEFVIEK